MLFAELPADVLFLILKDTAALADDAITLTNAARSSRSLYETYKEHQTSLLRTLIQNLTKPYNEATKLAELETQTSDNESPGPDFWIHAIVTHKRIVHFARFIGAFNVLSTRLSLTPGMFQTPPPRFPSIPLTAKETVYYYHHIPILLSSLVSGVYRHAFVEYEPITSSSSGNVSNNLRSLPFSHPIIRIFRNLIQVRDVTLSGNRCVPLLVIMPQMVTRAPWRLVAEVFGVERYTKWFEIAAWSEDQSIVEDLLQGWSLWVKNEGLEKLREWADGEEWHTDGDIDQSL